MKFSLDILDWQALAPGKNSCEHWIQWANQSDIVHFSGEHPKTPQIPMMAARRMSIGSRFAVETGLSLLAAHDIDAAIFTSRHGELERSGRILNALAENLPTSPTEFSMSVHNTAAGWLTIISKNPLPVTSLAAGGNSFQQGIIEAQSMLAGGAARVMLIDFDGEIPAIYDKSVNSEFLPYAVGILLAAGDGWQCSDILSTGNDCAQNVPQSLQFLRGYLTSSPSFYVDMNNGRRWHWKHNL